jgi:hypothetical protein
MEPLAAEELREVMTLNRIEVVPEPVTVLLLALLDSNHLLQETRLKYIRLRTKVTSRKSL